MKDSTLTRRKHSRHVRRFAVVSVTRQDYVQKALGIVRIVILVHFFSNPSRSPIMHILRRQ